MRLFRRMQTLQLVSSKVDDVGGVDRIVFCRRGKNSPSPSRYGRAVGQIHPQPCFERPSSNDVCKSGVYDTVARDR